MPRRIRLTQRAIERIRAGLLASRRPERQRALRTLRSLDLDRYQRVMDGCRLITRGKRAGVMTRWPAHQDRPQTVELWSAVLLGPVGAEASWRSARSLSRVRSLTLTSLKLLRDLQLLQALPGLRQLTLRDCPRLSSTDQLSQLQHLESLQVASCSALTVLQVPARLSHLTVQDCPRLAHLDIGAHIEHVTLRALSPSLTLSWAQPDRLLHLAVEQCGAPSLPPAARLSAVDTLQLVGDWRTLDLPASADRLVVERCPALVRLSITSGQPAAGTLMVSGCPRLEVVELPPHRASVQLSTLPALQRVAFAQAPAPRALSIHSCGQPALPAPADLAGLQTLQRTGGWTSLDVGSADMTAIVLETPELQTLRCTTRQDSAALRLSSSPRLQLLTWDGPLPRTLDLSGAPMLSKGLDERLRSALYTGRLRAVWPPLPEEPTRMDAITAQRGLPPYPATPGCLQVAIPPRTHPFYWERWRKEWIIVDGPSDVAYETQELDDSGYHAAVGEDLGVLYLVKPAPFLPPGWQVYEGDAAAVEHYIRHRTLLE